MLNEKEKIAVEQEPREKPKVGIIMGSDSDLGVMIEAVDVLEKLGVPYSLDILSAHRTPDAMIEYAKTAKERGLKVIIAGAGGAAHLPGVTAAETLVPVIGIPVQGKRLDGLDSLLSEVQMPPGVPVAVMAINGAKNAGLFAAQILAGEDPELFQRLGQYRQNLRDEVLAKNERLQQKGAHIYLQEMKK